MIEVRVVGFEDLGVVLPHRVGEPGVRGEVLRVLPPLGCFALVSTPLGSLDRFCDGRAHGALMLGERLVVPLCWEHLNPYRGEGRRL